MDFVKLKELFRDKIDTNLYVPLFQKIEIDLSYAIKEREKIILVFGESGNGKTFLTKKVYEVLEKKGEFDLIFFSNSFELQKKFDTLFEFNEKHKVVFIDEAQTLSLDRIEKLRMLADTNRCTIVLITHEAEAKMIFAKKHFQTRINYFINLQPLKLDRIELFITSKLLQNDFYDVTSIFTKSNYRLIYKLTKGNLREINRLMYKTFDVLEYFTNNYPHKVSSSKLDNKFIEIAYMDLEQINA